MSWTCLKCATTNPDTTQTCTHCGVRTQFKPPTPEEQHVIEPQPFRVPKQGEMTGALLHGVISVRAGTLSTEEFAQRIHNALKNVPAVFNEMMTQVEAISESAVEYGDEVIISLTDCQTLFEAGLSEMALYEQDEDDFHLRFGWLLIEKGEQEYVEILAQLQEQSTGSETNTPQNIFEKLMADVEAGTLAKEEYKNELEALEAACTRSLQSITADISSGVRHALDNISADTVEIRKRFKKATDEMGHLLLSLYQG